PYTTPLRSADGAEDRTTDGTEDGAALHTIANGEKVRRCPDEQPLECAVGQRDGRGVHLAAEGRDEDRDQTADAADQKERHHQARVRGDEVERDHTDDAEQA